MGKKKMESSFKNMVLVLFGVCLVSSALLGFVYGLTKDRIAKAQNQKQLKAIKEVILPDYDNMPNLEVFNLLAKDGKSLDCYPAKKGDQLTSIAIKSTTQKGFSGDIELMVGLLPDGTIHNISVIKQTETPGLGTKIMNDKFKGQFLGKNLETYNAKVKQDGGDVDGITAATISSRAFCDAVERAYHAYKNYKQNNNI